jgi:hypothetical protein
MSRKEHKEEQCNKIHIVSNLHNVVATADKELVHNLAEQLEQSISMHETSQFESIEGEVIGLVPD